MKLTKLESSLTIFIGDSLRPSSELICTTCRRRAERQRDKPSTSTAPTLDIPPSASSTPAKRGNPNLRREKTPAPSPIPKAQGSESNVIEIESGSGSGSGSGSPRDATFNSTLDDEMEEQELKVLHVPFEVSGSGSSHCICCYHRGNRRKIIGKDARLDIFMRGRIWIKNNARACLEHWDGDVLTEEALHAIGIRGEEIDLDRDEFRNFIDSLVGQSKETLFDKFKDVKKLRVSDSECKTYTGFNKRQFETIVSDLPSMRDSKNRSASQAVAIYLNRLRSGHTLSVVADTFQQEWPLVRNWCEDVESAFTRDLIPKRLGAAVKDRSFLIEQRTSPLARELLNLGDKSLAIICDGTYIYFQKSSYNAFQRQSYSVHKSKPLCKPFIACTTDGYIIDVWGSFTAASSDGKILPHIYNDDKDFKKLLRNGDKLILDRGFRDCVEMMKKLGFDVLIPTCKSGQLSWSEANKSRLCTKVRWVIESVNGILKNQFKLLNRVVPNSSVGKIDIEIKIAAALHNMFGKKLSSDHNDYQQIVKQMHDRMDTPNVLGDFVKEHNWNKTRSIFKPIQEEDGDIQFPQLDDNQLKMITLGTYQLKQATGYLVEHFSTPSTRDFMYCTEDWNDKQIIKAKLQSRHSSAKSYFIYVCYTPQSIDSWYCSCNMGAGTVGCCSHIAALIVYFSTGKKIPEAVTRVDHFMSLFKKCPEVVVTNGESDDEEE